MWTAHRGQGTSKVLLFISLGEMVRRLVPFMSLFVLLGAGCEEASDPSQQEAQVTSDSVGAALEDTEGGGPHEMKNEPTEDATTSSPSSSPPNRTLTATQEKRIGPRLQRVIRGEDPGTRPVESVGKRGGASVYDVIIRCNDAEALRKAGIPLNSVQGTLMTARLTLDQILEAATVEAVVRIQASRQHQMHSSESGELRMQIPEKQGGGR